MGASAISVQTRFDQPIVYIVVYLSSCLRLVVLTSNMKVEKGDCPGLFKKEVSEFTNTSSSLQCLIMQISTKCLRL